MFICVTGLYRLAGGIYLSLLVLTPYRVCFPGKQGLYLDTLDAARLEKIKTLESAAPARKEEPLPVAQKPIFVTPLRK